MSKLAIAAEIEKILKQGRIEGNNFYLPNIQLDRKSYVEVNKVLEGCQGKWNKKMKCHVFPSEPQKLLFAIEEGSVEIEKIVTKKKALQQFFTPAPLAKYVVELADVEGKVCLEPSAGIGNIALECLKQGANYITCVEIDEESDRELSLNLRKEYNGGHFENICADFLKVEPDKMCFDRVVANPPFTRNQDCKHVEHAFKFLKPDGKLVAIMANN